LGEQLIVASADADFRANADDPLWVEFDQARLHLFDGATEQALPADGAAGPRAVAAQA
jgi:multiple sugar transport system ATP-binding protein